MRSSSVLNKIILANKTYLVSSLIVSLYLIITLIQRKYMIDDPWLGEQAYWLSQLGYVKSELFRGLNKYHEVQLVYHKLHIWLGSLLINIFGWDLYVIKSLALIFLSLLIFILYKYFSRFHSLLYFFLFLTMFLSLYQLIRLSFVYRPEIIVLFFGFSSFFFLKLYYIDEKNTYIIFSGLLAGLSILTHLNGLIYLSAGFIILIINKYYLQSMYFAILAIFISCFYFIDILYSDSFTLFLTQFFSDPGIENTNSIWYSYLARIFNELSRLFYTESEIVFSTFLIITLILGRKYLKNLEIRNEIIYLIVLMVSLSLISPNPSSKYLVLYYPWLCIILSFIIPKIFEKDKHRYKIIIVIFFIINIAAQLIISFDLIIDKRPIYNENQKIAEALDISMNEKIAGPMTFVFPFVQNNQIQSLKFYKILNENNNYKYTGIDFFKKAKEFDRQKVIIPIDDINKLRIEIPKIGHTIEGYEYIGSIDDKYHLFNRINSKT